uniref:Putative exopolygalacturonase-like n=1 Tax=Davidia involucrata TaxID=16924 RepID=A0A5B6Z5T0_DAVIN
MAMKVGVSLISLLLLSASYAAEAEVFDVTKYGAKANGEIRQALLSAWKEACASTRPSQILVPAGTYKLSELTFEGPCKAPVEIKLQGTLQANADPAAFKTGGWVIFLRIDGLTISGGGTFDGQGATSWAKNNCRERKNCPQLPINLRFDFVTNSLIHDITSLNSKNFHINVLGGKNVTFHHVTVTAPGDSPNTDGIHIGRSNGVYIIETNIKTGDDCVSIGDSSQQIHVEKVTCGPGHGISVGSLGKYPNEGPVAGITVKNCSLIGTMFGVRIKTWPSSPGHSTASDMHFENIILQNVGNPVLIDQEYCPWNQCKLQVPSNVKISNVSFKNIRGTSSTKETVKLVCSKSVPCENVEIGDINLAYHGPQGAATTICSNIKPTLSGTQNPPVCVGGSKTA